MPLIVAILLLVTVTHTSGAVSPVYIQKEFQNPFRTEVYLINNDTPVSSTSNVYEHCPLWNGYPSLFQETDELQEVTRELKKDPQNAGKVFLTGLIYLKDESLGIKQLSWDIQRLIKPDETKQMVLIPNLDDVDKVVIQQNAKLEFEAVKKSSNDLRSIDNYAICTGY